MLSSCKRYLTQKILYHWYNFALLIHVFLWPLSQIYKLVIIIRRWLFKLKLLTVHSFKVPIIVVGNITVGGTGKTPVVIYLVELLRNQGFTPGVVSRGYKLKSVSSKNSGRNSCPIEVFANTDPADVGDEAVLIAKRTGCPLVVAHNRGYAVEYLLSNNSNVNIVISDDGLQHYALARDIEIAVVDGQRKFGNGYCLPAGPLREPITRLDTVDFILVNGNIKSGIAGFSISLQPERLYRLDSMEQMCSIKDFAGETVHAVAGLGNPYQFFNKLESESLHVIPHEFPDHHSFTAADLSYADDFPIIMTEKDAVKCKFIAENNGEINHAMDGNILMPNRCWVLPVSAEVAIEFEQALLLRLAAMQQRHFS